MIFRFLTFFLLAYSHLAAIAQIELNVVQKDGRFGLNATDGTEILPPVYDQLGWSDSDLDKITSEQFGYKEDGKWGLLSIQGKRLTEPVFYHIEQLEPEKFKVGVTEEFSNGLRFGLLNGQGKTILSCRYFVLERLSNAYLVGENGQNNVFYGLLDSRFEELLPIEYFEIKAIGDIFLASPNGLQWEIISKVGASLSTRLFDDFELVGSYLEVFKKGAKGLVDTSEGKMLFQAKYKSFEYTSTGPQPRLAFSWKILNRDLIELVGLDVDSVRFAKDRFIGYLNGQERIYRDTLEVLPDKYFQIKQASAEFMVIKEKNGGDWKAYSTSREVASGDSIYFDDFYFHIRNRNEWIVMSKYGRLLTKRPVQQTEISQAQYVPVKKNNQWGLIDYQGEEVLGYAYDYIGRGFVDTFPVKYVGSWGILNTQGNWVIQPSYDSLFRISSFYVGQVNGHLSIISSQGIHLSFAQGKLVEKKGGAVQIWDKDKTGIIAPEGALIFDPIYNNTIQKGKFYLAKSGEGSMVKNSNGEFVVRFDKGYEEIYSWDEGFFHIRKRGLHGFVDESGRLRIANRYDSARGFSEGKAAIKLIGRWGYINKSEQLIIQPLYGYVSDFQNGVAIVGNGKYGLINESGEVLLNIELDSIERTGKGSYILDFDGKKGLADSRGSILLSPSFDFMEDIGGDLIVVGINGKKAIYNSDGTLLRSFEYEEVRAIGNYLAVRKSS